MSDFTLSLGAFAKKMNLQPRLLLAGCAALVHTSIRDGSEITGAPGQPVDENELKPSYILEFPSTTEAVISTHVTHAKPIEAGVGPHGPLTLRSSVGGFGSIAKTVNAWDKIQQHVAAELRG